MEKKITELKAAAYDARAAYDAAVSRLKALPEFIEHFPTLFGGEETFDITRDVTWDDVNAKKGDAERGLQAAKDAWEAAEVELLNAVADDIGLREFEKTRPSFYHYDDPKTAMGAL